MQYESQLKEKCEFPKRHFIKISNDMFKVKNKINDKIINL